MGHVWAILNSTCTFTCVCMLVACCFVHSFVHTELVILLPAAAAAASSSAQDKRTAEEILGKRKHCMQLYVFSVLSVVLPLSLFFLFVYVSVCSAADLSMPFTTAFSEYLLRAKRFPLMLDAMYEEIVRVITGGYVAHRSYLKWKKTYGIYVLEGKQWLTMQTDLNQKEEAVR